MDLLLLARTTTKILVLRELLGMMELMDLHHLRELKDMVNGTVAVEKTSLMAAKLEKISWCNYLLTMESLAEDIATTFRTLTSKLQVLPTDLTKPIKICVVWLMLTPTPTRKETLLKRMIMLLNKSNSNQVDTIRLLSMGVMHVECALKLRTTSTQLALSTLSALVMESKDKVICGTFWEWAITKVVLDYLLLMFMVLWRFNLQLKMSNLSNLPLSSPSPSLPKFLPLLKKRSLFLLKSLLLLLKTMKSLLMVDLCKTSCRKKSLILKLLLMVFLLALQRSGVLPMAKLAQRLQLKPTPWTLANKTSLFSLKRWFCDV